MSTAAVEKLIWTLIYLGLLALCLGVFVRRGGGALGSAMIVVGAFASVVGALLVFIRSRMKG